MKKVLLLLVLSFSFSFIFAQKNVITVCTAIYSIIYFMLFLSMKEIPYGIYGGRGTLISLSSMSIKFLMTFGMVILGMYLKIGAKRHGDKYNTRGISNEA